VDLWILQAARVLAPRAVRGDARSSLDSLVGADADLAHAAEGLDPSLAFTLRLARALLGCGMPAHRVEEALATLAAALELDVEALCMPTALVITLARRGATRAEEVRTRVVRVEPGATDLERLSALHDLVVRVQRKELTPGDAALRIDAILARPPRYATWTTIAAFGLLGAASAVLLGGRGLDVPVSLGLGVLVGVLEASARRVPTLARLLPSLAAAIVAFLASAIAALGAPIQPSIVLLAAIIILLPGLTVTTAVIELATAHLVSGTARMAGGVVTFLQLGFGVALGRVAARALPEVPEAAPDVALPRATVVAAALASAVAFTVLLRARPRDGGWVLLSVGLALGFSQLGGEVLGAELGAFVGAAMVAAAAHALARIGNRPVNLMLTPGTLFLVPGSVGFLSVRSLLENDPSTAVATAFRMALVAMAIAAGILVATAAVPPRKAF
jgi:uncharacterized membrane protein YjjP (DUF1212 family)